MKTRDAIGQGVTFAALCLLMQVVAAQDIWVKKVRNATELVNAMVLAGSSGMPAEIKLVAGTYHLNQSFDSDFGPSSLPPITSKITIVGVGAATTIVDGDEGGGRVLTILGGGQLIVRNVTIANGHTICANCAFGGGNLANFGGSLQLDHCIVRGGAAFGPEGEGTFGGGLFNASGSFRLDDTQVRGNGVRGTGGGIFVLAGNGIINHSIVSQNSTEIGPGNGLSTFGGGLYIAGGTVVIDRSTVAGNFIHSPENGWLGFGAGIFNQGNLTIRRSSITGNIAEGAGAGGGIFNGGTLSVVDSTIGGNSAGTLGGGLYNENTVQLKSVTIADNNITGVFEHGVEGSHYPPGCGVPEETGTSHCFVGGGGIWNNNNSGATLRIAGSIVAGNTVRDDAQDCSGTLLTQGHNLFSDVNQCVIRRDPKLPSSWTVADMTNVDPLLGPLHTSTEPGYIYYPLHSNSPAIDAGGQVNQNCNAIDQVGQARTDGDFDGLIRCDIGSIEFRVGR